MHKERIWTLLARKLSGEATSAETVELENLLIQNPKIATSAKYVTEFWFLPNEKEEEFLEATFHLHIQQLKENGFDLGINKYETGSLNLEIPAKEKKIYKNFFRALAAVAFVMFIALFIFFNNSKPKNIVAKETTAPSEVSTKNGSRTKIQLPDGTSVWLNSSSKLVYDNTNFGIGIREVSLTGEAFFDVVKNPAKPFVIHTDKMDIKVLGTAFNVKCYPGDKNTETSLIRGSIEVTLKDRPEKIMMRPNEKLILSNESLKPIKVNNLQPRQQALLKPNPIIELGHLTLFAKDNSVVETDWVENRLVFSDETLEEITKKMERWYGVTIIIANDKLKKELLTGSFENETIYQALNALQITTPFTYKVDKATITINK